MRLCYTASVFAIATAIGSQVAFAESMVLAKTTDPLPLTYTGVSLDILGIKPGMSLRAAKQIVAANYKSAPDIESDHVGVDYKSIVMSSQAFPASLRVSSSSQKESDYLNVYFGTPATGNTVVSIYRLLQFNDTKTQPTTKQIYAALDAKYGRETYRGWSGENVVEWVFGKNGLLKSCSRFSCPCTDGSSYGDVYSFGSASGGVPDWLNSGLFDDAKKAMSKDEYICVKAELQTDSSDDSRVMSLKVTVNNASGFTRAVEAAEKQLHAAAVAAYRKEVKPQAEPKL